MKTGCRGGLRLAEAIEALRAELVQAMASAPVERVRFRPGPTDLTAEAALAEKTSAARPGSSGC